ncbi:speriolin-like protein [Sphaerodactylus townsendi]|uniref:speriolin-like protein n=1 Tax=Sphaerodactylus townsendi TaxID=933632 RepID=UPI0020268665|nr:speriolin-like protein [Sphaerodactylus townsendi]
MHQQDQHEQAQKAWWLFCDLSWRSAPSTQYRANGTRWTALYFPWRHSPTLTFSHLPLLRRARGCFIPVSVLKEPRFAHLVGGHQDLYHKYYALDLTALKDKPTVQSELAGKYFAPQSPAVAMAPVLATPPSQQLAMAPVLTTPQSQQLAMAPVLASSPQSPAVAVAPVLASSLQSQQLAVSPVLTVAQQSPTGSLDTSRYYTAVTSLSQHSPTGDMAPVLATSQQSPTGDLDLSAKYFAVSPSQQIPSGGLDLSGRYFAPILSSSQQSPTGDQELSAGYFAPVLSPSQQSPAGGLDLSGKYFGPVATSRPFSDQETSSHVPFKDSKQENMERVVGEIAFQLDRRILSAVFPDRNRLYGFTVSNVPKKVQQGGNDPYCKMDDMQAAAIMERYNAVMNRLKPLGYDPHVHPRLTEHVVNTFGILRERPELSGADAASYNSVHNLQSMVKETVSPDLRNDCLMLLSCLSQLSQDDGKPMFIW